MRSLSKKSRTLRQTDVLRERSTTKAQEAVAMKILEEKTLGLSSDPVQFFRQVVGFEPTSYQKDFVKLFVENQFTAGRWCRQSGKSWIMAALLLWYALTRSDSYIALVGPSWRQTKLNIRRISYFLRRLPATMYLKPQKTRLAFPNGSVIEAFPNNPDTIRGPTLHCVWWDEGNFTPNDGDLYDAILFTLGTTDGKLACTSTPWNTDSLFWKMCNHKDFSDFARLHVTWQQALEPNGPLKKNILEKIRKQFGEDPARWRREMEAEWAEDEDVWLPQSLIVSCVGIAKSCGEDLQPFDPEKTYDGEFFGGLDLAQVRDSRMRQTLNWPNEKKREMRETSPSKSSARSSDETLPQTQSVSEVSFLATWTSAKSG